MSTVRAVLDEQSFLEESNQRGGYLIQSVRPESPLASCNLKPFIDVIIAVDGVETHDSTEIKARKFHKYLKSVFDELMHEAARSDVSEDEKVLTKRLTLCVYDMQFCKLRKVTFEMPVVNHSDERPCLAIRVSWMRVSDIIRSMYYIDEITPQSILSNETRNLVGSVVVGIALPENGVFVAYSLPPNSYEFRRILRSYIGETIKLYIYHTKDKEFFWVNILISSALSSIGATFIEGHKGWSELRGGSENKLNPKQNLEISESDGQSDDSVPYSNKMGVKCSQARFRLLTDPMYLALCRDVSRKAYIETVDGAIETYNELHQIPTGYLVLKK